MKRERPPSRAHGPQVPGDEVFISKMRTVFTSILFLLTLPALPVFASQVSIGDVQYDGKVDVVDAVRALQISIRTYTPSEYEREAADTNADGQVNITDAILILRHINGLRIKLSNAATPRRPVNLKATARRGSVHLEWSPPVIDGSDPVQGYRIEFRKRGDSFAAFPHEPTLKTQSTITGLADATSYDFRIYALNSQGIGPASRIVSALPGYLPSSAAIHHILSTGQSLSVGFGGGPVLSVAQPFNNLTWANGGFFPLVEQSVETLSSSLANHITSHTTEMTYQVLVTTHGVSSTAYEGLKKGTQPYIQSIDQVVRARDESFAVGRPYRVEAVTVIHGESDHSLGRGPDYENYLREWQQDYERDIRAITGQQDAIPLLTDQMSSFTAYNTATSEVPLRQLSASEHYPEKIILVGPKYHLPYVDAVHLTNAGYRWLGEYFGKVCTAPQKLDTELPFLTEGL
ncbi:MAG: fibronectin type III domain-containing protein, partial [Armatimonadetes bacterium]|nr:fibronectin type III domain-containing protein [Armatimonadota bacterium]